ncbi:MULTISPECIES: hypothetical protein [Halomonadaceae]|nr:MULTISPECIES: hypothetical protein [Halomonas]
MAVKESKSKESEILKKAFFVTPIGPHGSKIRRATDGLIDSVVKPVVESYGYKCVASHQESEQGSISQRVIEHLIDDDLVIVNLTGLNSNVMYELGIRHSTGKPVILICENGTDLPFDMYDQRTIFYSDDMQGGLDLSQKLKGLLGSKDGVESNAYNPVISKAKENIIENALKDIDLSGLDGASLVADVYESMKEVSSGLRSLGARVNDIERGYGKSGHGFGGHLVMKKMGKGGDLLLTTTDLSEALVLEQELVSKGISTDLIEKNGSVDISVAPWDVDKAINVVSRYTENNGY